MINNNGAVGVGWDQQAAEDFCMIDSSSIKKRPLECSALSVDAICLAYGVGRAEFAVKDTRINGTMLADTHWEMLECSDNHDATAQYGYKAAVFINRESREVLIATAGTVLDLYDVADDLALLVGRCPKKIQPMKALVDLIIERIGVAEKDTYTFYTVGHSLGGPVSDLTLLELYARGLRVAGSRTYDNPGSEAAVQYALDNRLFSADIDKVAVDHLRGVCEVYNAPPNLVNTTQLQFGRKVSLLPPATSSTEMLPTETSDSAPADNGGGLQAFGQYLYETVGSALGCCASLLGLNHLVQLKQEHPLNNFANDIAKQTVRVDGWAAGVGESNRTLFLDPSEASVARELQGISSTGTGIVSVTDLDEATCIVHAHSVADVRKAKSLSQEKVRGVCFDLPLGHKPVVTNSVPVEALPGMGASSTTVLENLQAEAAAHQPKVIPVVGVPKMRAAHPEGVAEELADAAGDTQNGQPTKIDFSKMVADFFSTGAGKDLCAAQSLIGRVNALSSHSLGEHRSEGYASLHYDSYSSLSSLPRVACR